MSSSLKPIRINAMSGIDIDRSGTEVGDSRFFMWRAVVAMAHADKIIEPAEVEAVEQYLSVIPFSDEQKRILREDLEQGKDVSKMFDLVTDTKDRVDFFQFARMIVWSDGDLDAQEKRILEKLEKKQAESLDHKNLKEMVRKSRLDSRIDRVVEDAGFAQDAGNRLGIWAIISKLIK